MEMPATRDCKFCYAINAAQLHAYMSGSAIYYCTSCNYTFNIKSDDEMGKRKNKKNRKNKQVNVPKTKDLTKKTNQADDTWEVEIDCVEQCSKAPKETIVWFSPLAKAKIDFLMNKFKRIEWLAYILGDFEKLEVNDIFIPNQDVSSTSVDNVKCEEYNNLPVMGVIHSHHSMGSNFSHTDDKWINQNHKISLCISHTGISGHVRFVTKCGAYILVETKVRIKYETGLNEEEFEKAIDEKIKEKTWPTTVYNNYQNGYGYGYGYQNGYHTGQGTKQPTTSETTEAKTKAVESFLSAEEIEEIEKQIDELDFEKELSLAEELEMLNEVDQRDDIEAN